MNRKLIILLWLFFFISNVQIIAQEDFSFEFLPGGLNFMPLKANMQEAKIGVLYYPENSDLKVDIGNTIDLISFQFPNNNVKLNVGIEFMAYASVIGYQQLRLQIDAVDGFFGGNATYSKKYHDNLLQFRFRFIHNSAHLVDGNWWIHKYPRNWTKPGGPIPFTRDFAEFTSAHSISFNKYSLRYYCGTAYSLRVRPEELKRFSTSVGFELNNENIWGQVFDKPVNLFITSHLNFAGLPRYTGSISSQLGVKFGKWNSKGILFYFFYYTGNNFFSEYYNERIKKLGFGFSVDFL
jgi:hypothetical protein